MIVTFEIGYYDSWSGAFMVGSVERFFKTYEEALENCARNDGYYKTKFGEGAYYKIAFIDEP